MVPRSHAQSFLARRLANCFRSLRETFFDMASMSGSTSRICWIRNGSTREFSDGSAAAWPLPHPVNRMSAPSTVDRPRPRRSVTVTSSPERSSCSRRNGTTCRPPAGKPWYPTASRGSSRTSRLSSRSLNGAVSASWCADAQAPVPWSHR